MYSHGLARSGDPLLLREDRERSLQSVVGSPYSVVVLLPLSGMIQNSNIRVPIFFFFFIWNIFGLFYSKC